MSYLDWTPFHSLSVLYIFISIHFGGVAADIHCLLEKLTKESKGYTSLHKTFFTESSEKNLVISFQQSENNLAKVCQCIDLQFKQLNFLLQPILYFVNWVVLGSRKIISFHLVCIPLFALLITAWWELVATMIESNPCNYAFKSFIRRSPCK